MVAARHPWIDIVASIVALAGSAMVVLSSTARASMMLVLPLMPLMLLHDRGVRPAVLQPLMSVVMTPKLWMILLPAYWIARNLPWWPFTLLAPG